MSLSVYEHICFHGFVLVMLCSGTDYLLFPHYNAEQNEKTAVSFIYFSKRTSLRTKIKDSCVWVMHSDK